MAAVAPVGPLVDPSAAGLPAATGGAVGAAAVGKSAATLAALAKGFALGIGVSVAAATGNHLLSERSAPDQAAPSAAASAAAAGAASALPAARLRAPNDAPRAASLGEASAQAAAEQIRADSSAPRWASADPPPTELVPSAPSVASFPAADGDLAASQLKEEAALLRRARGELRTGAFAAAFATLEASRRRFTAPELSQEREALVIELLYRSGERAAAQARAREFLARFPESPHVAALRAFAFDPAR
jgi:hypothetical protein